MAGPVNVGPYVACGTTTGSTGGMYGVSGPGDGIGYYAAHLFPENTFSTLGEAEKAARLMNLAFQQGKAAQAETIRTALGI